VLCRYCARRWAAQGCPGLARLSVAEECCVDSVAWQIAAVSSASRALVAARSVLRYRRVGRDGSLVMEQPRLSGDPSSETCRDAAAVNAHRASVTLPSHVAPSARTHARLVVVTHTRPTMASIKTEAPAREQPKPAPAPASAPAPAPSTPNPNLDMLQGMLNLVVRGPTLASQPVALTTLCSC
jgi:hypothetical protein